MEEEDSSAFWKVFLIISLLFIIGCSRNQEEVLFKKRVNVLMEQKNMIETDFISLIDFKWDKVCFGYGPNGELTFIDSELNKKIKLKFDLDEFYINEKYFIDSPEEKCFVKGQVFVIERASGLSSEKLLIKYKRKIK